MVKGKNNRNYDLEEEDLMEIDSSGEEIEEFDDHQYNSLTKSSKAIKKSRRGEWESDPKYTGKPISKEEMLMEEDDLNINDLIEEEEEEEEKPKPRKRKLRIDSDPFVEFDDEEAQIIANGREDSHKERVKAEKVKMQMELWHQLIELRMNENSAISALKILPFPLDSQFMHEELKEKRAKLSVENLMIIEKISGIINAISGKKFSSLLIPSLSHCFQKRGISTLQEFSEYPLELEILEESLNKGIQALESEIESELVSWSEKTSLLTKSLNAFDSLLQTPVGQAKKAIEKNFKRLQEKSILKREEVNVLGKKEDFLPFNPHCYNDYELFSEIFKQFSSAEIGDEMDATQRYLQLRKLKGKSTKKPVDAKNSKARKLNFEVHDRLANFMAPQEDTLIIEGRDSLVERMKGITSEKNEEIDVSLI